VTVFETNEKNQNRTSTFSIAISSAFDEKNPVNFGPVTLEI